MNGKQVSKESIDLQEIIRNILLDNIGKRYRVSDLRKIVDDSAYHIKKACERLAGRGDIAVANTGYHPHYYMREYADTAPRQKLNVRPYVMPEALKINYQRCEELFIYPSKY